MGLVAKLCAIRFLVKLWVLVFDSEIVDIVGYWCFMWLSCLFLIYPGDPAGVRGKPGKGYGYGAGIRVDSPLGPLRLEYAFNDNHARRFHFGIGYRN